MSLTQNANCIFTSSSSSSSSDDFSPREKKKFTNNSFLNAWFVEVR